MDGEWIAAVAVILLVSAALTLTQLPSVAAENQTAQSPTTIALRLENDKALYLPGEAVKTRIFVTNVGNATIKLWHIGQDLVVCDSRGEPIYSVDKYLMPVHPLILTPHNETQLSGDTWNQNCVTADGGIVKAPAGIYQLKINVRLTDATNAEETSEVTASAATAIATTTNPNAQLIISSLTAVSIIAIATLAVIYRYVEKGKSKSLSTQV
jgi:hypothetical protein